MKLLQVIPESGEGKKQFFPSPLSLPLQQIKTGTDSLIIDRQFVSLVLYYTISSSERRDFIRFLQPNPL